MNKNKTENKSFPFLDCVNILPAGATLRIGPNLHLIVPEGSCALPVTLIPALPVARPIHQITPIPQPMQPANYTPAKVGKAY